jgi:S-adenosylmethionine decarboxylase proenzyme, Bacillus form
MIKALGRQLIVEFNGCDAGILASAEKVQTAMLKAASAAGADIIDSVFHHFKPYGVSGVVVISQSHFAIHTWPEHGYVAADLFTCGDTMDVWKAFKMLKRSFKAKDFSVVNMERGLMPLKDEKVKKRAE